MTQNKSKVIGITGGISTGKSTVTKIIKEKNFKVIDADIIAREVLNIDEDAYNDVVSFFGDEILQRDKSIDRSILGTKIFKNKKLRSKLNAITHPYIIKKIKQDIDKNNSEDVIFLDIPLLIEIYGDLVDNEILIDEIWLVYCDKETQIKRLMKRDSINYDFAENKIESQMDIEEKKNYSDKIICNMKNKEDLIANVQYNLEQIS